MEIYSIGFTKKTAGEFFDLLKGVGIRRLIDVRLNNVSQLAGFTKKDDLAFFLRELCDAEYIHAPALAPTQQLLDRYRKQGASWNEYERNFLDLMHSRQVEKEFEPSFFASPTVLLCSEPTAERCHRRLVIEYLGRHWPKVEAVHL